MARIRRERDPAGPNKLLALFAIVLYVMTGFALYDNRNAGLTGTLAFLAVAISAIAVFEPRMIGKFTLSYRSTEFTLTEKQRAIQSIMAAEKERELNKLIPLSELENEDG